MRLFVALEIPSAVRDNFAAVIREFRPLAPQFKWVRSENLHVTLKFIGEASTENLGAIRNALSAVRCKQSIELYFRGLGFLPNEKRPSVFWAGIESSDNMEALAGDIDLALEKVGIPRELRPFKPHLTLARLQPPRMPEKFGAAIQQNAAREFGTLSTREFHLIESKLKPAGAEYTTVQSFPFAEEEA
jgi:RNA 2',3'-cyclic 3'-phosphodiesterase